MSSDGGYVPSGGRRVRRNGSIQGPKNPMKASDFGIQQEDLFESLFGADKKSSTLDTSQKSNSNYDKKLNDIQKVSDGEDSLVDESSRKQNEISNNKVESYKAKTTDGVSSDKSSIVDESLHSESIESASEGGSSGQGTERGTTTDLSESVESPISKRPVQNDIGDNTPSESGIFNKEYRAPVKRVTFADKVKFDSDHLKSENSVTSNMLDQLKTDVIAGLNHSMENFCRFDKVSADIVDGVKQLVSPLSSQMEKLAGNCKSSSGDESFIQSVVSKISRLIDLKFEEETKSSLFSKQLESIKDMLKQSYSMKKSDIEQELSEKKLRKTWIEIKSEMESFVDIFQKSSQKSSETFELREKFLVLLEKEIKGNKVALSESLKNVDQTMVLINDVLVKKARENAEVEVQTRSKYLESLEVQACFLEEVKKVRQVLSEERISWKQTFNEKAQLVDKNLMEMQDKIARVELRETQLTKRETDVRLNSEALERKDQFLKEREVKIAEEEAQFLERTKEMDLELEKKSIKLHQKEMALESRSEELKKKLLINLKREEKLNDNIKKVEELKKSVLEEREKFKNVVAESRSKVAQSEKLRQRLQGKETELKKSRMSLREEMRKYTALRLKVAEKEIELDQKQYAVTVDPNFPVQAPMGAMPPSIHPNTRRIYPFKRDEKR